MINRVTRLFFFSSLLVLGLQSYGQNIVEAEYFIDHDLGVGNNTPITILSGLTIEENFDAITSGLAPGTYTLHIRTKDENGVWGFTEAREFLIKAIEDVTPPPVYEVAKLEFFINDDPGVGAGTDIPITQGFDVEVPSTTFPTSGLPAGYHTIGVRAQNTNGDWGLYELRQIYVTPSSTITAPIVYDVAAIEYFFDNDPGVGNATAWPSFIQNNQIDLNEILSETSTLEEGQHTLVVRSRNTNGDWGLYERRQILITPSYNANPTTPNIVKMEYFFDGNDPGVGNAFDLPITPGTLIDLDPVEVPTPGTLVDGKHIFSIRAQDENGMWSMVESDTFDVLDDCTQPIASFDPQLACAGSVVIFNNTSTDLQGDATYRWYLDGDNVVDETTQNASFTYPFPGTYVVALAVRQGSICLDSIATIIEIQPQPVAVFSTAGGGVNQATSFTASASNLPANPTWNWDFDGDFVIDDNTAGNTSFTYTSEGTFNPSLTITDSLGCFVTVTNPITITSGGGSLPPSANFLASSGCVGSNIQFIDLSQNLPVGATYSWDFDGNGEDSAIGGSTSFSYATAGTYTPTLTIDLGGGSTISASQTIEIVDIPVIDFTAEPVCEGTVMSFTNLSTPGTGSNVYMWDFDNDGVVDSNASDNVTHTYATPGSQIVSLKIDNGYGCEQEIVRQVNVVPRPTANFDWNQVCAGVPVLYNDLSLNTVAGAIYSWDLDGDGTEDSNSSSTVNFSFITSGTYNASLTVSNLAGCTANIVKPVEIIDIPEVIIDIDAQCYGQPSQMFDLSEKVNANASYFWDFGEVGVPIDETIGSTSHTYSSYNSYLVTLTIDNGQNCQATGEALVEFADAAKPDFATNKLCEGEEVIFTNLSTDVNPAAIYSWDFDGDGLEDSAFPGSTAFTFNSAGTYNATLTIDNGGNCLADKVIPLEITAPPAVEILASDNNLCEEGTVVLDAGTGYTAYLWPDGSTEQTYTVDQVGIYEVRIQDALLCYNTDTILVQLLENPVPMFTYSFDLTYLGVKVLLENTSFNANAYEWTYENTVISTNETASLIIDDWNLFGSVTYQVCLTAFNDCSEATICEDIIVSPTDLWEYSPTAFSVYPTPVTNRLNINLNPDYNFEQLMLFNVEGKMMWNASGSQERYELDVTNYDKGIYYILGQSGGKLVYQKISKL